MVDKIESRVIDAEYTVHPEPIPRVSRWERFKAWCVRDMPYPGYWKEKLIYGFLLAIVLTGVQVYLTFFK